MPRKPRPVHTTTDARIIVMITVAVPSTWRNERRYAVNAVLGDILGVPHEVREHASAETCLSRSGSDPHRCIRVSDAFFGITSQATWLTPATLPRPGLTTWQVSNELPEARTVHSTIPIIFGDAASQPLWRAQHDGSASLGLDVFGSAFFMLTRYEELVTPNRDQHDRFPASASIAYREGFLERPIINEYAEILWACMQRLWPGLTRPKRAPRLLLSHDVDWPVLPAMRPASIAMSLAGDVVKRRQPRLATRRLRAYLERRWGRYTHDPFNTFDLLMDISDEHRLRSAFYFIADRTADGLDGEYTLRDPFIRSLMRRVHDRGHEIGLHPSYHTYRDPVQLKLEFDRLRSTATDVGVDQSVWGGRQHYLRWEAPTTWRIWQHAGLDYDATVGYADHIGFRAGVCNEYRTFDVRAGEPLDVVERPLVIMEQTLLARQYMATPYDTAHERARSVIDATLLLDGDLTLLWHNSHLLGSKDETLLRGLLAYAMRRG